MVGMGGNTWRGHGRGRSMNASTVGIPWYRAETYALVRALVVDGSRMHESFESWLASAQALERQLIAQGLNVVRMDIDLEAYRSWRSERDPSRTAVQAPAVGSTKAHSVRARHGGRRSSPSAGPRYVASSDSSIRPTTPTLGALMQRVSLDATFAAFTDHWNP